MVVGHEFDCSVCLLSEVLLEVHEALVLLELQEVDLDVVVLPEVWPVV